MNTDKGSPEVNSMDGFLKSPLFSDGSGIDMSGINAPFTDEERKRVDSFFSTKISRAERLRFIEEVERRPSALISWDMDISFDEYVRRVRAGEYD